MCICTGSWGARVSPFNVGVEVFICNCRDFSTKRLEWFAEVGQELADHVGLHVIIPHSSDWVEDLLAFFSAC